MGRVVAALSIAALVLGACGGGGAAPATSAGATVATTTLPAGSANTEITVQGFKFGPPTLEVKVGTKVTWTNKDGAGHTTTSGAPGAKDGKWEGQLSGNGGTFSFTFAQAGTFAYFCAIHGASMTGTVIVK